MPGDDEPDRSWAWYLEPGAPDWNDLPQPTPLINGCQMVLLCLVFVLVTTGLIVIWWSRHVG